MAIDLLNVLTRGFDRALAAAVGMFLCSMVWFIRGSCEADIPY